MSEESRKFEENRKIKEKNRKAIKPSDFKSAEHGYRSFDASIPRYVENLEDSDLWTMVSGQLQVGSEIRVVAEDFSLYAKLLVTYKQGSVVKVKELFRKDLEAVDYTQMPKGRYDVDFRGPKAWCLIDTQAKTPDEEIIKSNIPTQAGAFKELEDFVKATAA